MNMTYKRSRAIAALAVVVIVAVCVAACGSSSSTSSSSSSSSAAAPSAGGTGNRAKLTACLKQHGVTLPSRPRGAGGYGSPAGAPNGSANGTTNSNGNGNGGTGNGNGNGNGSANGNGQGNTGSRNGYHNGGGFGGGGGRFNNPKFRAAFKACGVTAGFRGRGNFRPSSAAITKFAACVKQHGYTLPKPNLTGKGPVYPVSIERNAKFQAASRSCQSLLRPAGGGPPGGGAPPGA
jgi:hypothetical protein